MCPRNEKIFHKLLHIFFNFFRLSIRFLFSIQKMLDYSIEVQENFFNKLNFYEFFQNYFISVFVLHTLLWFLFLTFYFFIFGKFDKFLQQFSFIKFFDELYLYLFLQCPFLSFLFFILLFSTFFSLPLLLLLSHHFFSFPI